MVAMCSREQASSLCSLDLGECSGGVPGGVGVAVALPLPAAECCSVSGAKPKRTPLPIHQDHRRQAGVETVTRVDS